MSKQLLAIVGGIIVIILIAVGAYFMLGSKSSKTPTQNSTSTTTSQPAEEGEQSTIRSLIGVGKNVTCDVNYPVSEGTTSKGTIYVSGNKMRGDFGLTVNGKATNSHMISDGTYMYSWSDQVAQGVKFKIDSTKKPDSTQGNVDLDSKVDAKCSSWGVDQSKFAPPSAVTFQDLTQTINQTQNQSPTAKPDLSSVCNQITDPQAKAACLQQYGGN